MFDVNLVIYFLKNWATLRIGDKKIEQWNYPVLVDERWSISYGSIFCKRFYWLSTLWKLCNFRLYKKHNICLSWYNKNGRLLALRCLNERSFYSLQAVGTVNTLRKAHTSCSCSRWRSEHSKETMYFKWVYSWMNNECV